MVAYGLIRKRPMGPPSVFGSLWDSHRRTWQNQKKRLIALSETNCRSCPSRYVLTTLPKDHRGKTDGPVKKMPLRTLFNNLKTTLRPRVIQRQPSQRSLQRSISPTTNKR